MAYKFLDATANWSDPASTTYKYLRADGVWAAPDTEHKFLDATGNWSAMELVSPVEPGTPLVDCSWTQIKEMSDTVASNPSAYQDYIGQEKTFTCLGKTFTAVCVDLAHFEKQDGSGKAGFVFQFKEATSADYQMNSSVNNSNGYPAMVMYKTTLPNTIFTTIQDGLKNVIVEVNFPYNTYKGSGQGDSAFKIAQTHAKLFLPSSREVWGPTPLFDDGVYAGENYHTGNDGTQFAYWAQHPTIAEHIKYKVGTNTAATWWCRSCYPNTMYFVTVYQSGNVSYSRANDASTAVAPCFCI